jgi:S1-C subfamily serine protease
VTLDLRIVTGRRAGATERFEKSVVSVGRHPLSDLRFDPEQDLDVSTRHAELRCIDEVWTIHDQRSTNGTFVNGLRVEGERVLRRGDLITFGANGPRVEVLLPPRMTPDTPAAASAVVDPPAPAAAARVDTGVRVAAGVKAKTRSLRRAFAAGSVALVGLAAGALLLWQRQASSREAELLALMARSESTSAVLERTVMQMVPRDSAFAALLTERALSSKRAGEELRRQGGATAGTIALYSSRVAADARMQQSIAQMDLASVHDRNDAAVAMIASDLDGTFIAGTAFGVTREGLLVTNRHVARAESGALARRVRVIFSNSTEWLPAHVVTVDPGNDLALLQLDGPGPYPVVAGVSRTGAKARIGAPVASIGYPHATDIPMEGSGLHITARSTIAAGTVSKRLDDVIQIDSYAGKGSSGSPLFDAQANVVGVIFGGAPESGGRIVYAVPAERLAAFLAPVAAGILRN